MVAMVAVITAGCGAAPAATPPGIPVTPPPTASRSPATISAPSAGAGPSESAPASVTSAPSSFAAVATGGPSAPVLPTPIAKHAPTPKPGATLGPTPVDIGVLFTANVDVMNLGQREIDVAVDVGDPSGGGTSNIATLRLQEFDLNSEPVPTGLYVITFTRPGGGKALVCNVNVVDKDQLHFVATDAAVLVARDSAPGASGADLVVPTSKVCQG